MEKNLVLMILALAATIIGIGHNAYDISTIILLFYVIVNSSWEDD
jgi:hypothetical protein